MFTFREQKVKHLALFATRRFALCVIVSGMDYGTVRIILEKATSSPANVELPELDEAIRWVEERATIRRLDRGTDRDVYSSQFEAAAVEMRVLRQLLAHGWFAGTVKSADRVLTLLGREISLPGVENSRQVSLFFHYFLYWIAVVCCIVGLGSVVRRDSSAALN